MDEKDHGSSTMSNIRVKALISSQVVRRERSSSGEEFHLTVFGPKT
jgi:hypothetical protein